MTPDTNPQWTELKQAISKAVTTTAAAFTQAAKAIDWKTIRETTERINEKLAADIAAAREADDDEEYRPPRTAPTTQDLETSDAFVPALLDAVVAERARADKALEVLADLAANSPCTHFDHHGYCQTHGWLQDGECAHARARKLLSEVPGE